MKNLPKSIPNFKINEKNQTIRYKKMYQENVRWEKEYIFKCLIFMLLFLSPFFLTPGIEFHIFALRCIAYILLGLSFLAIVAFAIIKIVIEDKLWEKQVAKTYTIKYQWLKIIYQISLADLRANLDYISKKENASIAEHEFYEKYRKVYDKEYVEYLEIPLWHAPSD